MLARLAVWLFDGGGPEHLPERVRVAIQLQQERSEVLIGWIQLAIVTLIAGVYHSSTMAEGLVQHDYSLEPQALLAYAALCIVRIWLAHTKRLARWMLYLSVIADVALLMALIWSFHFKYAQPAAFYLKVPTLHFPSNLALRGAFRGVHGCLCCRGMGRPHTLRCLRPRRSAESDP